MNIAFLYAHPNPKSFNHSILSLLEETAKEKGINSITRDIYKLDFDPVLKASDFELMAEGQVQSDVKDEQEHIKSADLLVVIYPIWWTSMPANLRGYIDRVFCLNFAYSFGPQGPDGLLKGKKAYIVNTLGANIEQQERDGFIQAMETSIDVGIFNYCGIEVIGHDYFGEIGLKSKEDLQNILQEIKQNFLKHISS